MIWKSSIYRNAFLLSVVLLTMGYLAMGYDSKAVTSESDEKISPLYEVRMTQFADEMGLSPNGTIGNSHEYGSIDTMKLTVLSQTKCNGDSCPLEKEPNLMGIGSAAEATGSGATCPDISVRMGRFVEAMGIDPSGTSETEYNLSNITTQRLTIQSEENGNESRSLEKELHIMAATSWNTCTATCGSKSTCWNTCVATCGSKSTCWNTCVATCGTKSTCWQTCPATCGSKSTCWNTCVATCGSKSTCWQTCPATCGTKSTCWQTCPATCGTKSTCWNTCAATCGSKSTCWNTCAAGQIGCCPNNRLEEIRNI